MPYHNIDVFLDTRRGGQSTAELANALMKKEKYPDAISYLSEAIEQTAADAIAYSNRGLAFCKSDQPARALDDWIFAAERGDSYSMGRAISPYRAGIPEVVEPTRCAVRTGRRPWSDVRVHIDGEPGAYRKVHARFGEGHPETPAFQRLVGAGCLLCVHTRENDGNTRHTLTAHRLW